jgi:chromosome partitioning protein
MAKIVSLINLKGGVAKTTTTVQLAECLVSEFGRRVLVVDLDPQTNATIALIPESKWEDLDGTGQTLYQAFSDKLEKTKIFDIKKAIQKGVSNLRLPQLHLLASSIRFIDIQDRIADIPNKTKYGVPTPMEVLKQAIEPIKADYDYILIDCPPNLGYITQNGIEISDFYLIPTIPDTLSTYGIPQIINSINEMRTSRPQHIKIKCLGLVMTKFMSNSDAHKKGREQLPVRLAKIFEELELPPSPVFNTVMPQANQTAEAMDFGAVPGTFKAKYGTSRSGGITLYQYVIDLAKEFQHHVG